MKILIVDDNATIRRLVRLALKDRVDSILESTDGAYVNELYEQHLPDLVLMDIRMPLVDGLTATKQLIARFPKAKVLILTDYDEDDLRSEAQAAGACGYALKHHLDNLDVAVAGVFL